MERRLEALRATYLEGGLTTSVVRRFRRLVYDHYRKEGRELPWRRNVTPYRVVVSELMLQQTQVSRVETRFEAFVEAFPSFPHLARAPLSLILEKWQGLGYNRRAVALKRIAEAVTNRFAGELPSDVSALEELPGIGPATARSIGAFAFDAPTVFLETNVRTVFIHLFCENVAQVRDEELLPLVEETLDRRRPRLWYNALMDFGTMLKRRFGNASRRSRHYSRQSPFEGSNRQIRGLILKTLVAGPPRTLSSLATFIARDRARVRSNLETLEEEGFVYRTGRRYTIAPD